MGGRRPEWWLGLASVIASALLAECGARAWIAWDWPEGKAHQLTHPTTTRGRFSAHPELPYVPTAGFVGTHVRHDDRGFRGAPVELPKPSGRQRVVLMGASTVYGVSVEDHETSAVRLREELARRYPESRVDVVNGGVPGWTSRETLLNLRLRVLPLDPDLVVMIDGRNEIFPQVWRGYRDDYTHYRRVDYDFRRTNLPFKRLFRISHLAMLALTQGPGHLGFSNGAENPVYGSLRWRNQPDTSETVERAGRPEVEGGYRANLRGFVAEARRAGVGPVLSTIAYRPEAFNSGVISRNERLLPVFGARVARNNELVRAVARETGAPFVDLRPLSSEAWLEDDCHFRAAGELRVAELLADTIGPLLAKERGRRSTLREAGAKHP